MPKRGLIIANGTLPSPRVIRILAAKADLIVCADGGANGARKLGIRPDVILGDFDSISRSTRQYFRTVPLVFIEDQNSTDMEKAIDFCIKRRIKSVDVVGATGGRIDHTTGNLGCFKKFGKKIDLRFIDVIGVLTRIDRVVRLSTTIGEKLSLIPLERCSGVSTRHLKYPLRKAVLELGVREGISNEATASTVEVSVKRGTLLLYRFHQGRRF